MKNIKIVTLILSSLLISNFVFSQQLSRSEITALNKAKYSSKEYCNKSLADLLINLPNIKMIRIMPDNPEIGFSTVILGFVKNNEFSKLRTSSKIERITIFVKDPNNTIKDKKLFQEDINSSDAIIKYGSLKIINIVK